MLLLRTLDYSGPRVDLGIDHVPDVVKNFRGHLLLANSDFRNACSLLHLSVSSAK